MACKSKRTDSSEVQKNLSLDTFQAISLFLDQCLPGPDLRELPSCVGVDTFLQAVPWPQGRGRGGHQVWVP